MKRRLILARTPGLPSGILEDLRPRLEQALPLAVEIGAEIPLDPKDYSPKRGQYRAPGVLFRLRGTAPARELLLVVTDADLFSGDLVWLFGRSDPANGTAPVSVRRLAADGADSTEAGAIMQRRLLVEALHEIGHLLGLEHCDVAACVMHAAYSTYDIDRKQPAFVGSCASSVEAALAG